MPDYSWPTEEKRILIGKRISRVDSPVKVSGQAKYTYDVKRPDMLFGKVLRCPYAHAKVVSIDTAAAEKMPGVKAIHIIQGPNANIHWAGDDIVAVAGRRIYRRGCGSRYQREVREAAPSGIRR
jgi:xanthine dehydrogenase YagR molybdenum-binding subunit